MQSRRKFLTRSLALGCTAAASPLVTPVTFASAPGDARLVVIVLRGAMDGLDVVRPMGDPDFARHRPTLDATGSHDLNGLFALHPALGQLMPLWRAGELSFAHATSTPYRDKRSHFDGQDILETGGTDVGDDGWLNRAISKLPGTTSETAFAVGRENLMLLSGPAQVSVWSPDSDLDLSPQAQLLLEKVYAQDPLFQQAAARAMELAELTDNPMSPRRAGRAKPLAEFAAGRLKEDTRIAAFSINGWDTHANQHNTLPRALGELSAAILTLKSELGPIWGQTAVLCLTEFGRTVQENGSRGTDHGTGGAAIFAGGALKGRQVLGTWPGMADGDLYEKRDLMPTSDVRSYAAWALHALFPLAKSDLRSLVFPGLDMGENPGLIT
ncbi:MAG: DUF1501 domain-containing protein [Silicimonas sp.]|nr:DUF1501 domain-containing protein [Silicimonas sp.]